MTYNRYSNGPDPVEITFNLVTKGIQQMYHMNIAADKMETEILMSTM